MEKERGKLSIHFIISILLMLVIGVVAAFLYPLTTTERLRCIFTFVLMLLLYIFSELRSTAIQDFLYDNQVHRARFYYVFCILFGVGSLFPLFTSGGWPLLTYALVLMLLSNAFVGMVSYVTILSYLCILGQTDMATFLFHFICGMSVIVLFSLLNETFKVEMPMFLSLLCYVFATAAHLIVTQNVHFTISMLLVPGIGLFVNGIMMFIFLWYMNVRVISTKKSQFQDINDPDYPLMQLLKNTDESLYYEAIHTAYLCNKIATRLQMNADIVRGAGFYLHADKCTENEATEDVRRLLEEYHIPEEMIQTILDAKGEKRVHTKEGAVVVMADLVIRAILSLIRKDPQKKQKLQYDVIISGLFDLKIRNHYFDECNISYQEMVSMRTILTKEDLYYELLH